MEKSGNTGFQKVLKKIISSLALFIFIIGFVQIFTNIFGDANSLVGVTILISVLVLLQEDLTKDPLNHFLHILALNMIQGMFSHLAGGNMYLGIVLNFLSLFIIGYILSFKMNKILIVPFGLQYLFMLYTPVTGRDYQLRLIELAVGAAVIMLSQFIVNYKKRPKEEIIEKIKEEPRMYKELNIAGHKFNLHYIRSAYAVRVGLVTAFSAFLVAFFNIPQGRWLVYTVFSLTELYSEHCHERSKQRLEGTIIGAAIVMFLFIFIKDNSVRGLIVLAAGYIDSFTKNYRQKMICVTASVIASVSLVNGSILTAIQRVFLVALGVLIALVFDKIIMNRKIETGFQS